MGSESLSNQLSFTDKLFPEQTIDHKKIPTIEYPEACRITLDQYFKFARHGLSPRKLSLLPKNVDEPYIEQTNNSQKKELTEPIIIGVALHNIREIIYNTDFSSIDELLAYMHRKNGYWLQELADTKSKKKGNLGREEEKIKNEIVKYYSSLDFHKAKDKSVIIFTALSAIRLLLEKLNYYQTTQFEVATAVNLYPYYSSGKKFLDKIPLALVIDRLTPTSIIEDKITFPTNLHEPILQLSIARFVFVPLTAKKFPNINNFQQRTIKEINETIVHLNTSGDIYSKYRDSDNPNLDLEIYSLSTGEKIRLKNINYSILIEACLHANEYMQFIRTAKNARKSRDNKSKSKIISRDNTILEANLKIAAFNLNCTNHLLQSFFQTIRLEVVEALFDNQAIAEKYLRINASELNKNLHILKETTGINPFKNAHQIIGFE